MNVEIGTEAAQFREKEYTNGIFLAVWPEIIKLFPARESLVSDIPTGDEKIATLIYSALLCDPCSFVVYCLIKHS
jgi:hypothetical protein